MTPDQLRIHLETLFGRYKTADRASQCIGCSRRAVFEWMAGDKPIPKWIITMIELRLACPDELLPERWK